MAVNGFSALTSDFVCTARAWTHPVCSIHTVYGGRLCLLWVWCVQRCTCLEVAAILIRFEGSGDKVHWGVTELLQTDSSSQHPASPRFPSTYSSSPAPSSPRSCTTLHSPSAPLSLPPSTFILSAFYCLSISILLPPTPISHSALYHCLSASGFHYSLTLASTMQSGTNIYPCL